MKKSVYLILILLLVHTDCSNNLMDNDDVFLQTFLEKLDHYQCDATDAILYPEFWTSEEREAFVVSAETINSMSTCGLLLTLLEYPDNRLLGPWSSTNSNLLTPGVTDFNNKLRMDKIAVELFERIDCFPVLSSEYLEIINEKMKEYSAQTAYFEMLLASDMCMSALNAGEKNQLMALALQMKRSEGAFFCSPYIMIAIMKSCNYAPFMKEINPYLVEMTFGYNNLDDYDILKYAKKFLKEQK